MTPSHQTRHPRRHPHCSRRRRADAHSPGYHRVGDRGHVVARHPRAQRQLGLSGKLAEEARAASQQHGDHVEHQLVDQPVAEELARDIFGLPMITTSASPATAFARARIPAGSPETNVNVVPFFASGERFSWVTTKTGLSKTSSSPHGSCPESHVRRPNTIAPAARKRVVRSAAGVSPARRIVVEQPAMQAREVAVAGRWHIRRRIRRCRSLSSP